MKTIIALLLAFLPVVVNADAPVAFSAPAMIEAFNQANNIAGISLLTEDQSSFLCSNYNETSLCKLKLSGELTGSAHVMTDGDVSAVGHLKVGVRWTFPPRKMDRSGKAFLTMKKGVVVARKTGHEYPIFLILCSEGRVVYLTETNEVFKDPLLLHESIKEILATSTRSTETFILDFPVIESTYCAIVPFQLQPDIGHCRVVRQVSINTNVCLDENGVQAEARVALHTRGVEGERYVIDRPFIVAIVDYATGTPLFESYCPTAVWKTFR